MQCKCGGETRPSTHNVTTLKKAQEWGKSITDKDLPIVVHMDKCSCGRQRTTIKTRGN